MADEKANYERPASQVDLEARQKNGNASFRVLSTAPDTAPKVEVDSNAGRDYTVEGNDLSAYSANVDPEYKTYANEAEAPFKAENGPEKVLEDQLDESGSQAQSEEAVQSEDDSTPSKDPAQEDPNAAVRKSATKKSATSDS